mmetsp:Transcript_9545/g.11779  ORF Transcript_9545/g.11779 Transcript_9545/m.11779 type:complete len:300 (+) Transcript_9545:84-983(+)|eukprot:CAMPEP_0194382554 /NCGR_PEP_ID=MMETSP0174-20130528/61438_1 /TAXON_ID=216777 /ORGANISM="Proboscia alata, Strain PI-D3" /LENGTH=299 /DNA_ID=CAMNT_0039167963 /DNA_START=67 /DNA_END=966 /DNA_ORIENTATION=+
MADLSNLLENINVVDNILNNDKTASHTVPGGIETDASTTSDEAHGKENDHQSMNSDDEENYLKKIHPSSQSSSTHHAIASFNDLEYEHLKLLWTQEMACPELLPYDAECVDYHLSLLRQKEEEIDGHRQSLAASENDPTGMLESLSCSVERMECDRLRFVLTDLYRIRLQKIEKYPLNSINQVDRMGQEEVAYLQQYGQLIENHFHRSVLDHLPKRIWRNLDDPEMIDKPNLEQYVFCKVVNDVVIDERNKDDRQNQNQLDDIDDDNDEQNEHVAGSSLIGRYSTVRDHIMEGNIILLA